MVLPNYKNWKENPNYSPNKIVCFSQFPPISNTKKPKTFFPHSSSPFPRQSFKQSTEHTIQKTFSLLTSSPPIHIEMSSILSSKTSYQSSDQIITSAHTDYIHDIKFDFYGHRLASCSGDQNVCVYNLDDSGNWVLKPGSEWQAHKGVVWRLAWAHPEFGQL